jgi:hypothetical protein
MIAAALVALSLFGERQTLLERGQQITTHHHVGGWTVKVSWDRFTGGITCAVNKGRVEFKGDVLIFHSDPEVDNSDAVFRIDGGPARSVHEATFDDERRGYYRKDGPLANPSAGEVALPSFYVTGAKWVYIRANPHRAADTFDVRRFSDALALARAKKCPGIGPD